VTHLRKIMLEELDRRNCAQTTIDCYLRTVKRFFWYFNRSPNSWAHNTSASKSGAEEELPRAFHTITVVPRRPTPMQFPVRSEPSDSLYRGRTQNLLACHSRRFDAEGASGAIL